MRAAARAGLTVGLEVRDAVVAGPHGGIPVRRYTLAQGGNPELATLVWLHGGGFAYGGLNQAESHAPACVVARTGREVVAVDYRLAQRVPLFRTPRPADLARGIRYPVPLDDVVAVVEQEIGTRPDGRIVLGGASAGANLSASTALRLRRNGRPGPERLLLAYGSFHATLPPSTPELTDRMRGLLRFIQITPKWLDSIHLGYTGSREVMAEPFAFPGGHDVTGMPAALVLDADRDTLRASGELFAEELRSAGTEVDYRIVPHSSHGFLNRPRHPTFAAGFAVMLDWLGV